MTAMAMSSVARHGKTWTRGLRRWAGLLVLGFLATTCVTPASPSPPPPAEATARPQHRELLWELRWPGHTSFLFGTLHLGAEGHGTIAPAAWQRLRSVPCFVMESNPRAVDQGELLRLATLPAGQSLRTQLGAKDWHTLHTALKRSMPNHVLERLQPWFATMLYLQTLLPATEPMDGRLATAARQAGKSMIYLETWREALTAFAKVTTVDDLQDLLAAPNQFGQHATILTSAYESGDPSRVEAAIATVNAMTPGAAAKMQVLINERNQAWLPRLEAATKTQDCFVAVGAGHLVGPGNLRELLSARGAVVQRRMD